MLGGTERLLWLLLLLLQPPPSAWGYGDQARPREGTEEAGSARAWLAFQGLRERLRAAGALSRHYWASFSCRVWPQDCGEDEEPSARSPGKIVGLRRAGAGRRDARGPLGSRRGVQSLVPVLGRRDRGHQTSALAAGSAVPPSLLAELKAGQPLRNREPSSLPPPPPPSALALRPSADERSWLHSPPSPGSSRHGLHFPAVSELALSLFQGAALAHILDDFKENPQLGTPLKYLVLLLCCLQKPKLGYESPKPDF